MYSGRHPAITPLTATLQIVALRLSGSITPITSSGARSVNFRNSCTFSIVGGTMGSPSPFVLVEEAVYFLEGAGEDDIFGRRLRFGITVAVGLFGQPLDNGLDGDIDDIAPQFLGALNVGMTGDDRELHVGQPQSYRSRTRLPDEALAYQRYAGQPGHFCDCARPQHGGRTT